MSRIESRRTENKRFTHDWFLDNFTKTYSCNTTRHGYIRASNCMLETRPIQVIKRMFLQGHLYQASFPQLKFQIPAPNADVDVDSRSSWVSRVESELLETKQRPFWFDESRRNQESRGNNRESTLDSRLSWGSRIECQLTFERYCMLFLIWPPSFYVYKIQGIVLYGIVSQCNTDESKGMKRRTYLSNRKCFFVFA